jgi:hypothetical protein
MTSLLGDERGQGNQVDEMTFSNIAGVLPAVDKVSFNSKIKIFNLFILTLAQIQIQILTLIHSMNISLIYRISIMAPLGSVRENAIPCHPWQLLRQILSSQWKGRGCSGQSYR